MKGSFRHISLIVFSLLFLLNACKNAPTVETTLSLPRSVPETESVSSGDIMTFLDSVANSKHQFHSLMILRHGKVVAEGWWAPYGPDLRHTLYSTSKSFTSTAVGFAVAEKLLTVNDTVISFFPDDLPDTISPFLADLKVKDLLTMSVGQDPDPTFTVRSQDTNWVKSFLALPVIHDPGTKFLYNSMATYMLSAIVQKVTGEKLIDYLTPRLFKPLGMEGMDWEIDPRGINTGGWGLRLKTEDMAKFGQLYLQKGLWNGKQILPAEWIEEATTFKIDQAPDAPQAVKDSNDWMQGYCYQFWRCRHNAFRADGAYGQYIIVMPDKDAVIAITSESPDMGDELNLIWKYLLPAFRDEALPGNPAMAARLKEQLASLGLPLPLKGGESTVAGMIDGESFSLETNDQKINSVSFNFQADTFVVRLIIDGAGYTFKYGEGKWINSETDKPGPNLLGAERARKMGLLPAKIAGAYNWTDNNTLTLVTRYIESPHSETITCRFDKNIIFLSTHLSMPPGRDLPEVKGRMSEK